MKEVSRFSALRGRKRGFSLVELIVVVSIMAILSLGVMVTVGDQSSKALESTIRNDFAAIAQAVAYARSIDNATVTITDGVVQGGNFLSAGNAEVQKYLSTEFDDFNARYKVASNVLGYYDEAGAALESVNGKEITLRLQ